MTEGNRVSMLQPCMKELSDNSIKWTKVLLRCGVVLGPLFYLVVTVQAFTRAGFDLRRHPLSLLSLGDAGWIQIANFILTGLLAILCAYGMRRFLRGSRAGTWGALLIAIFGLGMIIGGLFSADSALGFPPGTADIPPAATSWHAVLHAIGFCMALVSLIVASFVYTRRFISLGYRGWGLYSLATGIVAPILIIVGMRNADRASISFALATAIAFGWLAAISVRLLTELAKTAK
jgi:Protein of unknown function (DUF998)